jgi:hypothetical protein
MYQFYVNAFLMVQIFKFVFLQIIYLIQIFYKKIFCNFILWGLRRRFALLELQL